MLDAERALAAAESKVGVIPAESAAAIAEACTLGDFDLGAILEQARAVGNPAEPLVRALRTRVGEEAARWVHFGATSQDVIDTAAMLVARNAVGLVAEELDAAAAACAALAEAHRDTPMAGRTLLQQAVPITFGAKAAGWLARAGGVARGPALVPLPGTARRRSGDARGAGRSRPGRAAGVRGGARAACSDTALAHLPAALGDARSAAGRERRRVREDRARRGPALPDRGPRGRRGGRRPLVDDAPQAQPRVRDARARVCAPRACERVGAGGGRARARTRGRRLACRMDGVERRARTDGRCGRRNPRVPGRARGAMRHGCARTWRPACTASATGSASTTPPTWGRRVRSSTPRSPVIEKAHEDLARPAR